MPDVIPGYPEELSDQQIKGEIKKLRRFANGGGFNGDRVISANAMIQSGQAELAGRFTKRTFWMMLALTLLSILAAGVSIYYAMRTDGTDNQWKSQELTILQSIDSNTKK